MRSSKLWVINCADTTRKSNNQYVKHFYFTLIITFYTYCMWHGSSTETISLIGFELPVNTIIIASYWMGQTKKQRETPFIDFLYQTPKYVVQSSNKNLSTFFGNKVVAQLHETLRAFITSIVDKSGLHTRYLTVTHLSIIL